MPSEARQRAEEVIERAKQEVFAICKGRHHGGHEWRMSIPVNEERDSDRIIMAGLNAANDLLAAEVQRAVAVQQTKYDELRIQFQAAQEKIDQLRAEKQRAVDAEREAILAILPEFSGDACYDPFSKTDCTTGIAAAIRARQRAGGYDPEVGYFDAWKGSD